MGVPQAHKYRDQRAQGIFAGKICRQRRTTGIETCVECFLSSAKKIIREHLFFLLRNCTVKMQELLAAINSRRAANIL